MPEVPWASNYKKSEITALWGALKRCCGGSDEAARQAVSQNSQVICPVYATPELLTQTNDALVKLVGKKEALQILIMNPMVLTCGAVGLATQKPADIRSAAQARQVVDRLATPTGLVSSLVALGLLRVAYLVAIVN